MYNIITWKEGDVFVGKVLENSVSSFGNTQEEAYKNTKDALELYNEGKKGYDQDIQISSPKLYSVELSHA